MNHSAALADFRAPCERSHPTRASRPVSRPSAASKGVPSPHDGVPFSSAPRARRYSAIRRWPPLQACQNASVSCCLLGGEAANSSSTPRPHAQRRRLPVPVNPRPALDQQAGHLPAPVPNRVIKRAAACDRGAGGLNIGAAVNQRPGHFRVVAARRPVQWRFRVPASLHRGARISARLDQHGDHLWPMREESRPVRRRVQRRTRAALVIHDARSRQARMLAQQFCQRPELTSVDRRHQRLSNRITSQQPQLLPTGALCSPVLRHDRRLPHGADNLCGRA